MIESGGSATAIDPRPSEEKDAPPAGKPRRDDAEALRQEIMAKLAYSIGKDPIVAQNHDWLVATILAVRDRIIDRWMASTREAFRTGRKRVYYLSLEFLIGRLFKEALSNLGLTETVRLALRELGVDLDTIADLEPDAALGNGGLGRLAACFMESMATVGIPALGYGIRYDFGLFRQTLADGWQIETPEDWLSFRNPWEFERREANYQIGFGGTVAMREGWDGAPRHEWVPSEIVLAVAYDTPIPGWRGEKVNTLRLWRARALDPIHLEAFNKGDHVGALAERTRAESISRVLYPSDATPAGQELRLRQEFFFTSASLQDLLRRHLLQFSDVRSLPEKAAIQLNDTHPALAVAELMRLLVDGHNLGWEEAWEITQRTIGYTNHTLLPEALESWPVTLMEGLLPRHMQIIFALNARLLADTERKREEDGIAPADISLIDESHGRAVRMGFLAFVGAHKVNGVSELHTQLMKRTVFRNLHRIYPDRIVNKTNGVTPRRWLFEANPGLTELLVEVLGKGLLDDIEKLSGLAPFAEDGAFQEHFFAVKLASKERLATVIAELTGLKVDPRAMFDVQVKRIHEYKRQLLNILQTIALYDAMRTQPHKNWVPRVKIFAGKAAANYVQAKLIIKLINDVARIVNSDPSTRGLLKVVFLPNYNVSLAEAIIPAADLSEQISTAGMEASGTGNMKLALNGAITIGTLDGANVEIREKVGPENIVIFGLTAAEVEERRRSGPSSRQTIDKTPALKEVLDAVAGGVFSPDERNRYHRIVRDLEDHDWFMVAADFADYVRAQEQVAALWRQTPAWRRSAVLNTAHSGWFSSDRAVQQYAEEIWGVPVHHKRRP
ncbi:MAG: glycogen/starch/alpha-glucan phosphorylase [Hyphomicrobiales bacterium]|nr:glycogen/starch/alpha-glucan phosphorylase [Hyphomicrobiales bacterium]MBV9517515.1 glycogen/starch/alpha-glucan phosphorylase [Hyphomicrobiales bacterium]